MFTEVVLVMLAVMFAGGRGSAAKYTKKKTNKRKNLNSNLIYG